MRPFILRFAKRKRLLCVHLLFTILLGLTSVLPPLTPTVKAAGNIIISTTSLADDANDGVCTLREALQTAFLQQVNGLASQPYHECTASAGPTTITFGGGAAGGVITLASGENPLPMINKEVIIVGPVTIRGGGVPADLASDESKDSRLFRVTGNGILSLLNLTLNNGYTSGFGAAILGDGVNTVINLTQVAVVDNQAMGDGGAIYTSGALNILASNFAGNVAMGVNSDRSDNPAIGFGGAISIGGSDALKASLTSFSGNIASKSGGAIANRSARLGISDTTFNGNIANATGGQSQGGGAIFNNNNGAFTLVRTLFNGNLTPKGSGGAIYNNLSAATTVISDTLFNGNISGDLATPGRGGAIYSEEDMQITRAAFNGNIATRDGLGGAIVNNRAAILQLTNSTLLANFTPDGKGGALANIDTPFPVSSDSTVNLRNVTLTGNRAQSGGAIYNEELVALWNTIVEESTVGAGGTCAGSKPVNDNGHNLQNPGAACGVNMPSADPKLDMPKPGANFPNILTMSPKEGSPAIDGGDDAVCNAEPVHKEDQTGSARPSDGDGDFQSVCDIGAVENGIALPGYGSTPAQPGPIDFGNSTIGAPLDASFAVYEAGSRALVVASFGIEGPHAADFTLLPSTTFPLVIPNGTEPQPVNLRCTPSGEGIRTATLSLVTDDPKHLKVDYDLVCNGTIVQTPGFAADPIAPGPIDFGTGIVGLAVNRTLQISENGTKDLNVTLQSISGNNAADFQVMSGLPALVVNNGVAASVTVRCTPAAIGIRTAVLTLATDDPTQPTVNFDLVCTGAPAPVPFLEAPGTSIADLDGAYGLAVSPDGRQVYVTNYYASSLTHFNRDLVNGQLSLQNTVTDPMLQGARKVAISPDGRQVYVTASTASRFTSYARDPISGALSAPESYQNNFIVQGLTGAHGVAVSPDGRHIYVASVDEDALVTFSRDNDDFVGYADAILSAEDLNGARGVAVSPDGSTVYVVGYTSNISGTLAVYGRNVADGTLTHVQTRREGQLIGVNPIRFQDGLAGAHAVTVSADGNFVYVAGLHDNSITVFQRNQLMGAVSSLRTYKDGIGGMDGLGGTTSVAISPDGTHLFTTALTDQAVGIFDRDTTTGLLAFNAAIKRDIITDLPKLDGANEVAISPDGATAYAVAGISDAIVAFAVTTPKATLDSLLPASAPMGSQGFTLVIKGKNFVGGSQVQWNGSARPTTFVSPSEVRAAISAADLSMAGSAALKVVNPAPGGGDSHNALAFQISAPGDNPTPSIDYLNPQSIPADVQQATLDVIGANFVPGSQVRMNGADRPTVFINSTLLQVTIGASDVVAALLAVDPDAVSAAAADANQPAGITVFNPAPGGGTSNVALFTVVEAGQNLAPSLVELQPATIVAQGVGATPLTIKVLGENFVEGAQAEWNGALRSTKFINANELEVTLTAVDVGLVGNGGIRVANPAPGGGESNVLTFAVTAPPENAVPALVQLLPATTLAQGAASVPVMVVVVGNNFLPGSQIYWNGVLRLTQVIDSTQLQVTLAADDVANGGTGEISVLNPPPGGGMTTPLLFTIYPYGLYLPVVTR